VSLYVAWLHLEGEKLKTVVNLRTGVKLLTGVKQTYSRVILQLIRRSSLAVV
jgi:hypothetical protein